MLVSVFFFYLSLSQKTAERSEFFKFFRLAVHKFSLNCLLSKIVLRPSR